MVREEKEEEKDAEFSAFLVAVPRLFLSHNFLYYVM